jgi:hypothetical protein
MTTVRIRLRKPHPKQRQVLAEAARFNVGDFGRRWGKSLIGENILIKPALSGAPVGWFSPTYKMLAEAWREVKSTVAPVVQRRSEQDKRLELYGGGSIEFWSLDNPDVARGRKYGLIVVDEAAMVPNLMYVWDAVLRPTLVDMTGGAWFFSTPKGRNGFWQLWQRGQDEAMPDWKSWRFPTSDNPFIKQSEIDEMRRTMPERIFRQEVLAEFLDDAGGVFRRVIEAAVLREQQPEQGRAYIFGVDWAKYSDFTVISVLDASTRQMVYQDRFNQIDYSVQTARLKALAERYKPQVVIAETNSIGEPLLEQLRADGLPVQGFTTTNASKQQIIDALALAFERGDIKILNDQVLINELQAYESTRLPGGGFRYSAPEGMHDDTVMALAMAYHGISDTGSLMLWE